MAPAAFRLQLSLFHSMMHFEEQWEVEVDAAGAARVRTRGEGEWREWRPMPRAWTEELAERFKAAHGNPHLDPDENPPVCDGQSLFLRLYLGDTSTPVTQAIQMMGGGACRSPMRLLARFLEATSWPDVAPTPPRVDTALRHAPPELMAAFGRAVYRVFDPAGTLELRPGRTHPRLAALLGQHQAKSAALLTACNPMGVRTDDALNNSAMDELARALQASGQSVMAAEAADDKGAWREPGFLVIGLGDYEASALAHRFRQAAWLGIDAEGRPTVRSCVYYPHGAVIGAPTWPPRD